jgi:hypothetical protein
MTVFCNSRKFLVQVNKYLSCWGRSCTTELISMIYNLLMTDNMHTQNTKAAFSISNAMFSGKKNYIHLLNIKKGTISVLRADN